MENRVNYGSRPSYSEGSMPMRPNYNVEHKKRSKYSKSLCIIPAILLLVTFISIAYFDVYNPQQQRQHENTSHAFFDKPDNTQAYPSTIEWRDPHQKPPPKGSKMPGAEEKTESVSSTPTDPDAPPLYSPSDWYKSPPINSGGTTVNGITYGGDDVTDIEIPSDWENNHDGEVPLGGEEEIQIDEEPAEDVNSDNNNNDSNKNENDKSSESSSSKSSEFVPYPTKVDLNKNRIITLSDFNKASSYYHSNGADDLIASMPYLDSSSCVKSKSNCGFKQYSGYLMATNNAEIHYWFIEAEEDPMNKPIFFWTNGGPGCSGMDGLLTEHGPWRVDDALKIHYNEYSWNTEVNMVYLEQPYGVGFSATDYIPKVVSGDQNAADDMDAAIRNFLTKFPLYKNNRIYLSSESWGGHYVPITAYTILTNNDRIEQENLIRLGKFAMSANIQELRTYDKDQLIVPIINFGGFFLGNPYTDFYENAYGFVGDIYGHGLMKSSDWDTWRSDCWGNEDAVDNNVECSAIYSRAYISAYNANVYALDWPQCYDDEDWNLEGMKTRPAPSYWIKDAHIHHAAKDFMLKVLSHHDYKALKMSLEKSELQQFHDKIARQLELEYDDLADQYQYPPQQGQQQGQGMPPQQGGMPPQQGGQQQPAQGMPQQPAQGGIPPYDPNGGQGQQMQQPGQNKPEDAGMQKPQQGGDQGRGQGQNMQKPQGGQGQNTVVVKKPKVPGGVNHNRPNHNLGDKATAGSQAERDEAAAKAAEEKAAADAAAAAENEKSQNIQEYGDGYLPCIEYDMADYLNLDSVQQALHVKPTEWQMCSDEVWNAWPESDYDTKVEAYYAEIIDNYLVNKGLKLAVYSGDDDSVCGIQGTQYWLDRWKYAVNDDIDWEQWEDEKTQLGGFYSQYMMEDKSTIALHFLSVRTAGHMVPTTQPARALTILKKYLYDFSPMDSAPAQQQPQQGDDEDNNTEDPSRQHRDPFDVLNKVRPQKKYHNRYG